MSSGGYQIPEAHSRFYKKNTTVDLNASECSDHSGNMLDRFRTFFCRPLVLQIISQLLLSSEIGPLKVELPPTRDPLLRQKAEGVHVPRPNPDFRWFPRLPDPRNFSDAPQTLRTWTTHGYYRLRAFGHHLTRFCLHFS